MVAEAGPLEIAWDGLDNDDNPFPAGQNYAVRASLRAGELHFPFIDVENNLDGAPGMTLINPPNGECPPFNGGCSGAFYDDRGYETADNVLVGVEVNGALCPGAVGNPPEIRASDPIRGFDSTTNQRAYGFPTGGNPARVCLPNGGFGDKKGLDQWTYYPSNTLISPISIVPPTAITLDSFTATREGGSVVVRWTTSAEIDTLGFHLYRSADGTRANAMRVTQELILGQGRGQGGAPYSWTDTDAEAGTNYAYWLHEVEISGATNEYGPAVVTVGLTDVLHRVVIPLVSR
jgi:hypothetical protein